jgi:TonB-dependent receptor
MVENVGDIAADFRGREDLLAAYAMVELPLTARLTLIPGVRHEYSRYEYSGSGFDGITTWPLSSNNSDRQWLPGVNVRYAAATDTIVRAALTRSFARPDFADLVPHEIRTSAAVASGNPLLKPTVSWNADVAIERYVRPSGVVSVAVFAKKLDQYIYSFDTTKIVNGETITFTQPQNGDAATIMGIELSFEQQLRMLPAPLDALSVYATYTRTTSNAQYPLRPRSTTPLQGQTPHLGNVTLAYERSGFSGRLATNFHGHYLRRIRMNPNDDDHAVGRTQMDLSMAQMVGRRTWLVFDVNNLTDARSQAFGASPSQVTSIERFGRYATFGFRLAF